MGNRQRLIFTALVVAGIGMFVVAGLIGRTDPPDAALRVPGVEGITPERGAEVLQQQRVGIDLEPGFVLRSLTIAPNASCQNGVEVVDFTDKLDGLEQYFYQPDEGKPITQLSQETNCALARIEDLQRPGTFHEVEWAFTVA